ncbi:MAG: methylenetetrahydrofolate--tRNA-(uracil(54)-C(5))-methyltransferase (FADH(2)-oxidizing) TrmFO [Clostridiales bacterium]|nr:methylenetetrahydrofolate--tRNA-(uracil(54)-C(5))-methyltransferase (FADH(2)-oxidizing) TrmFO [Clostridiales bacterium]
MKEYKVTIIGGGLAGCEAAWQLANRGVKVDLYEMRPNVMTPAHNTASLAELVCSNSFRSNRIENAVGLLKEEMRRLNSLIIKAADEHTIPAGGALAVDRQSFSDYVTAMVDNHRNITINRSEATEIPESGHVIIATGPLSSQGILQAISGIIKGEYLYFYDAAAPIVAVDSIDTSKTFKASRYGRGDDYLNCPMDKESYSKFWEELVNAERASIRDFEKGIFEGCMPIEVMASRGIDTLRFGPLKPVGLIDPHSGKEPYAVVQLRQDNHSASLYNMVGFQTNLKFGEQRRVFSLIPGLENAEFVRYGVMHRNTYINSPSLLNSFYQMRDNERIYFAGQITGVEGYVESAASGLVAGYHLASTILEKPVTDFPSITAIGSLSKYISNPSVANFQPMNVNFGIIQPLGQKIRNKQEKNRLLAKRALEAIDHIANFQGI